MGLRPVDGLDGAGAGFSRAQRRRVRRAMYRGEPLPDPAEARYAIAQARALGQWQWASPVTQRVVALILVLLVGSQLIDALAHGHVAQSILYGCATVLFAFGGLRPLAHYENVATAPERYAAALDPGEPASFPHGSPPSSRMRSWAGVATAFAFYAISFGAMQAAFSGEGALSSAASGVLFGAWMVIVMRYLARRSPRTPAAPTDAQRRRRRIAVAVATAGGTLFVWICSIAATDSLACPEGDGPPPPRSAMANAFCQTPGATHLDSAIIWTLAVIAPTIALIVAITAAARHSGPRQAKMIAAAVGTAPAGVWMAWFLATTL